MKQILSKVFLWIPIQTKEKEEGRREEGGIT
jgi:hypothetical protein